MKQIRITPKQLHYLMEGTWNYHLSNKNDSVHNGMPYKSDSKYVMDGRDTGSFGSGTYFSTYKGISDDIDSKYGESNKNHNPNFIQIDNNVYRVDIELYKNLYRVYSEKQGNVLYTLLYNVNKFFSRITSFGKFNKKEANYRNADLYQKIVRNASALKLKCPSYLELTRMAQELGSDDRRQSFSTLFMEYNGYNGVNVSGVPQFDNTLHGSVIYDLSKVEAMIKQESPNSLLFADGSYKNTVVNKGLIPSDDYELSALNGQTTNWLSDINQLPLNRSLRLIKNYIQSDGKVLDKYEFKQLSDVLQKRYLRLLYNYYMRNGLNIKGFDKLIPLISQTDAYYWVNYFDEYNKQSVLISLLYDFENNLDWDLSDEEIKEENQQYLKKLMNYRTIDLQDFEKYYLGKMGIEI